MQRKRIFMSKELTKDNVIRHKKQAIKQLNNLLEMYINNPDGKFLKKADLLSYWLENFSDYIKNETTFNPQGLISYKRGDVIKLNFGFNVGSEHGGMHYAIVLDNNNLHSSPVVTVIPLSSGTAYSTYRRDVFLGQELYIKLNAKHKLLLENTVNKINENDALAQALNYTLHEFQKTEPSSDKTEHIKLLISDLSKRVEEAQRDLELLKKYKKEISHMKQGSTALMEQITTISKMRIYVPKKSTDILYGISFSPEAMDKVSKQLLNLYLKDKF